MTNKNSKKKNNSKKRVSLLTCSQLKRIPFLFNLARIINNQVTDDILEWVIVNGCSNDVDHDKFNEEIKKIKVEKCEIIIASDKNLQYYRSPLESTPLALLLDKEFIIKNISKLREELVNEKFYMFSISEKNKILNLFFEKDSLNLIGWQTEDVYQNLTVTYIFDLKINNDIETW